MMSDMKVNEDPISYTVRDLNRRTAEVLAAAAKFGSVTIRARSGARFLLKAEGDASSGVARLSERLDRQRRLLRELGHQPPSAAGWEELDQIVAGER